MSGVEQKIMKEYFKKGGDASGATASSSSSNGGNASGGAAKKRKTYPSYKNLSFKDMNANWFCFDDEWDTSNKNGVAAPFRYMHNNGEAGYFDFSGPQLTTFHRGFGAFDESKGEHNFGISLYNPNIKVNDHDIPISDREYSLRDGMEEGKDLTLAQEALQFYHLMQVINTMGLKKALARGKNNTEKLTIQANYSSLIKSYKKEDSEFPRVELMNFSLDHTFEKDLSITPKITTRFYKLGPAKQLIPVAWEDAKAMCVGGAQVIPNITATRLWVGSKSSLKFKLKSLIIVKEGTAGGEANNAPPVLPENVVIFQDVEAVPVPEEDYNDEQE